MREVERYALYDEIASGGMATVYLARLRGQIGFSRLVAIKALHAQYAKEEAFRAMFLDEARLVSRVRHPNVVQTVDVLESEGDLFLVMEYVHGESLSRLLMRAAKVGERVPIGVACSIFIDTLEGLHAAHEATAADGAALSIVHRDVSPQNILVGVNGAPPVADFGIAKAAGRLSEKFSVHNAVKGKAGYMAPEQVRGKADRRSDIYAVGVVLWETLVGKKLFTGDSFLEIVTKALDADISAPSTLRDDVSPALDDVVRRAVVHDLSQRFATAREMAVALEKCGARASQREVGAWVAKIAHDSLERRGALISRIEAGVAEERPDLVPKITTPKSEDRKSDVETVLERVITDAAPITILSGTISGEQKSSSTSRAGRIASAMLVMGASAAGVFAFVRTRASHAAIAEAPPGIAQSASTVSIAPPPMNSAAPIDPPASTQLSATNANTDSTTTKHHATTHHDHSTPPPSAKDAGAVATGLCHWEQLPDEQGIMIPKKVCP